MTQLAYTLMVVPDIPRSVDFYVKAYGASNPQIRADSQGTVGHGEVDLYGHRLGFTPDVRPGSTHLPARVRALETRGPRGAGVALYLSLPTAEEFNDCYRRAQEHGAKVVTQPEEQLMGGRRSFFASEDPDGYLLYVDGPVPEPKD